MCLLLCSAIVREDPGSGARPPAQRGAEAWTPAQREAARRAYMAGVFKAKCVKYRLHVAALLHRTRQLLGALWAN